MTNHGPSPSSPTSCRSRLSCGPGGASTPNWTGPSCRESRCSATAFDHRLALRRPCPHALVPVDGDQPARGDDDADHSTFSSAKKRSGCWTKASSGGVLALALQRAQDLLRVKSYCWATHLTGTPDRTSSARTSVGVEWTTASHLVTTQAFCPSGYQSAAGFNDGPVTYTAGPLGRWTRSGGPAGSQSEPPSLTGRMRSEGLGHPAS